MLCPPTNAVKTPLLRCLQNTEIILITPYGLFYVSSRHNYGKFRLHGLQPSCQDTMPSGSLTCEIPILEVAKKHGMRSKSSSPLEFFYWSSPKIMQKQLHLSLNSPCSNWKTDNNETIRWYRHGHKQGCISCGILLSGTWARGVSSEHMENMEMFSCSPT